MVAAGLPGWSCSAFADTLYHGVRFDREVFDLIQSGFLQEALWASSEAGNKQGHDILEKEIEEILKRTPYDGVSTDLGRAVPRAVLKFPGGISAIFTPTGGDKFAGLRVYSCASCEVAAYKFDRAFALNIVPVTVLRSVPRSELNIDPETVTRSVARRPENGAELGSVQYSFQRPLHSGEGKDTYSFIKMTFLDYVSGNSDRNARSWSYWRDGHRVIATDHGMAFRKGDFACEEFEGTHFKGIFAVERDPDSHLFKRGREISSVLRAIDPVLQDRIFAWLAEDLRKEFESVSVDERDLGRMTKRFLNVQRLLSNQESEIVQTCKIRYWKN